MTAPRRATVVYVVLLACLAGCGGDDDVSAATDGGMTTTDGGMTMTDTGTPEADSGTLPEIDGGATPDVDSGTTCSTGMTGPTCEDCAEGYQDVDANATCELACDATGADAIDCGVGGACAEDATTGTRTCACDAGYEGALCETCSTGFERFSGTCRIPPPPALGLSLWLDADDAASMDVNASMEVTAWRDHRSFITLAAAPTTGTARPEYQPMGRNGRGAVRFDGTTDQMAIDDYSGVSGTDYEIIFAGEPNGETVGVLGAISGTTDWAVMIDRPAATDFQLTHRRPAGTTGGSTVLVDRATPSRPMYIAASHQSSAAIDSLAIFASDDPSEASGAFAFPAPSAGFGSPLTLRIGRTQAGRLQGKVYEILIYTRRLTVAERAEVAAYLRTKWNLP